MGGVSERRRISAWVVVFLVALVNLPLVHSTYLDRQVASSGVEVDARLTGHAVEGSSYAVEFEYGPDIDPGAALPRFTARVDREAYDRAVTSGAVQVRVLADRPSAYEVHGHVPSRAALWATLVADLLLLGVVALFWGTRRAHRAVRAERLHLVAIEDVQRCKPGSGLEQLDATTYVVTGEVCLIDDTGLELMLGERRVRVDLDGHENPAGYEQPARVTARLSDSGP